ncbi:MAG: hypothetical protein ACFB51_14315 [Anaerolineae bacterium]
MFHQTNALFAVPVAIFLLLDRHTPAIFLTYASVGALTTLGAYGAVGLASQFDTVGAFMDWFMGYTQSGLWGGFLAAEHLPALRSGLQVAVSTAWPLALAFYALGFVGVGRLIHQTIQDSNRLPWLVFGLLWLLIYGVFFWWWEPWNIEFWIASLPAWGMFILAALAPKEDSQLVAASLACVPFVLSALLVSAQLPQMRALNALEDDYFFQLTTALEPTLTTDDIVVTRGNVLDLYLPFYIEHPLVFSMREASFDAGSDRAALLTMVTARLDEAWRTGRIVVLDAYLFNQPLDPADNAFGLTEEEIDTLQSRYQWVEGPLLNGEPAFYTFPRYTDPTASAWSFDGSLLGWSAYGVSAPRFAEPGWCFTGGFDPQVSSPQLSLDASRFTQLEVDVSVSVSGLAAEIFWRTPESDYSLERSATLDLQRGRHTYTVNLAGMPGWQGTITRLRVDPIPGDQDGVDVCLYGIALTR